jgi:hypothetical protein
MPLPKTHPIAETFVRQILPWIFLLVALYQIRLIASGVLGKESFLEVWITWMSSAKATRLTAFTFGLAGVAYGLAQRALRRASEQRLASRLSELEGRLEARGTP